MQAYDLFMKMWPYHVSIPGQRKLYLITADIVAVPWSQIEVDASQIL